MIRFNLCIEIKNFYSKFLNLGVIVIAVSLVLIYHKNSSGLVMPLHIRFHSNLIALIVPRKERKVS